MPNHAKKKEPKVIGGYTFGKVSFLMKPLELYQLVTSVYMQAKTV